MTDLIQSVLRRSVVDRDFRALAVRDSGAAVRQVAGPDADLPDTLPVAFAEPDASGADAPPDVTVFVLPAYGGDPLDVDALDAVAGGGDGIDSPLCMPDTWDE